MKLLLLSDVHLRTNTPSSRKDNFFATQLRKFIEVLNIYKRYKCQMFLQAGDLFDSPDPSYYLLSTYIKLLLKRRIRIHAVFGQHDMHMYSEKHIPKTAMNVLKSAGVVEVLSEDPILADNDVMIYGASYGQDIPEPEDEEKVNILVCHYSVGTKKLFPTHQLMSVKHFARHFGENYDLVLCGDYHYKFCKKHYGTRIVNTGVMVRLTRKEIDNYPCVYIYDTETDKVETIPLEIQSTEEVFSDEVSYDNEMRKEKLQEMIMKLKESSSFGVSFEDNLLEYFNEHKVSDEVKEIVLGSCNVELNHVKI